MLKHRYLCWLEGEYFSGHDLLNDEQILGIVPYLLKRYPVFESAQVYDKDGTLIGCPIFIDLDHKDYYVAKKDCEYLKYSIQEYLGVTPEVYFSGNKGFHLVIPYYIKGEYSHLIVREIVKELGEFCESIDFNVYGYRRYLRMNGSKASREGFYKIPCNGSIPSHEEMLERARQPVNTTYQCDVSSIDVDFIEEIIKRCTAKADEEKKRREKFASSMIVPMTPCIKHILVNEPDEGQRQLSVYVLAKYFKSQNIDEDVAIEKILANKSYREFNNTDRPRNQVINTVERVYRTAKHQVGCRGSSDNAELMRQFCSLSCIFNKEDVLEFPRA